jgi:NADH:ubiquinone oxidoreductase subunit 6 (subunit J)
VTQGKCAKGGLAVFEFFYRILVFLFAEIPAITFSAGLGFAAIYLLLPRPRRYPVLPAVIAGALSLVLAGVFLIRAIGIQPEAFLFYTFAGIALVAGALLVTQHNPVKAALSFALVILSTCGLFLLQAAPFLMAATIIVYAGAIIVTFLFVIMLAQQSGLSNADLRSREPLLACVAGCVLLGSLFYVLRTTYDTHGLDALLHQVVEAMEQNTPGQARHALGDRDEFLVRFQDEAKKLRGLTVSQPLLDKALKDLDNAWDVPEGDKLRRALEEVYQVGSRIQAYRFGSLEPSAVAPLSAYSGTPANMPVTEVPLDRAANVALPAANVAALGRSLFTDYLLAVELAGTLLLVATVGAIAIAGRRTEGVR